MKIFTVDWRHFQEADDGNTSYYGGYVTVTIEDFDPWYQRLRVWVYNKMHKNKKRYCNKPQKRVHEFGASGSDRSGCELYRNDQEPKSYDELFTDEINECRLDGDLKIRHVNRPYPWWYGITFGGH